MIVLILSARCGSTRDVVGDGALAAPESTVTSALPTTATVSSRSAQATWTPQLDSHSVSGSATLAVRSTVQLTPSPSSGPSGALSPTATRTETSGKVLPGMDTPHPVTTPVAGFCLERPFSAEYQQWAEPSYPYGSRARGAHVLHTGADYANTFGTPILACGDATIAYAGNDSEIIFGPEPDYYGNVIIMHMRESDGDEPVFVLYAHMQKMLVETGQTVHTGDVVGYVGMTGIAVGPHLHVEVRLGENSYQATRNPELWFCPLPGCGTIVGRLVDADGRPLPGQEVQVYSLTLPDRLFPTIDTYLDEPEIHPSEYWNENFVYADVLAGEYLITASQLGYGARTQVFVAAGQTVFVEIRAPQ